MIDTIKDYWNGITGSIRKVDLKAIEAAAWEIISCHNSGNNIYIVGNGGSAATASHFACDLSKGARVPGQTPFRVLSLTDNMSLVTAWANDSSFEHVFAEQLRPMIRQGDLLIVISASGNSPNVVFAAQVARDLGARVLGLTGKDGGKLRNIANLTITVPTEHIEQVEDAHLVMAHCICFSIREYLTNKTIKIEDSALQQVFQANI
ncbi:sugar isomerase (SIS) [Thermobaculum terrenum ATCC BAA-798]|uniref:Sugar isomerase (SIS) n=1 Tax=Thermobaculum terrenum (strain ATCC BAA-798 / CCMEE 7001 / YNP1) TaxID=525904 RepID=D1CDS0_THET1|nr:SIS domain-containing protein [Thermobaculum terrenum]ACZ41076.1 sugar isomerase (SIS) [Thermobaculum terrenum ATCC BAA-798]